MLRSPGSGSGPAASTRERQVWRLFPDRVGTRGEPGCTWGRARLGALPHREAWAPCDPGRSLPDPNLGQNPAEPPRRRDAHWGRRARGARGRGGSRLAPPSPPCLPSVPPPLPPPRRGRGRCSRAPAPPRPHKGPSPWQPRGPERSAERGPGAIESCRLTSRYEMGCRARGAAARGGGLRRELLRPGLSAPGAPRRVAGPGPPAGAHRAGAGRPNPGLQAAVEAAAPGPGSCSADGPRRAQRPLLPPAPPEPLTPARVRASRPPRPRGDPRPGGGRPAWFRVKPGFPRGRTCPGRGPTAPGAP